MLLVKKLGGYYALQQRHKKSKFKKIYQFILRGLEHETGSYLPFGFELAGPFNLPHGYLGIFISGGSVIGKNCTIYHHVTIGSNMLVGSKHFGSPTIGDNCMIGAGAKIIGKVSVGNNCRIGANCVITTDIPDDCVVTTSKAMIVQRTALINKVFSRKDGQWGYWQDGKYVSDQSDQM